ncbi:MAG: hypothetical protein EXS41_00260 [Opitutaceae bacterium]|nr:hypothetical protein [Opitutaceae bacterium]
MIVDHRRVRKKLRQRLAPAAFREVERLVGHRRVTDHKDAWRRPGVDQQGQGKKQREQTKQAGDHGVE